MTKSKYKSPCARCGKLTHGAYLAEEGFVCWNCSRKDFHKIPNEEPIIKLDKALNKIYELRPVRYKKKFIRCSPITPPKILIGKKVKLVIVE